MVTKNPQDRVVFIGSEQTPASLSSPDTVHTFAFNPDEVKWSISNNSITRDTIGGRVVQLLSARVEQMTVVGKAGSRGELQRLAVNLKKLMEYQTKSQRSVRFKVPSKGWNFKVYIQNVSSLGWDYAATTYPYELTLLVEEDTTGLTNLAIREETLARLATNIGYVEGREGYHGGNAEDALAISEAYLNSFGFLRNIRSDSTEDNGAAAEAALSAVTINKSTIRGEIITQIAATQLGVPYGSFGSMSPNEEFDCSGLTRWVYWKATGKYLPHNAEQQRQECRYTTSITKGDLVFFWYDDSRHLPRGTASHVGIYMGVINGVASIIDAASGKGKVWQHPLSDYDGHFIGGGRVPETYTLLPEYLPNPIPSSPT